MYLYIHGSKYKGTKLIAFSDYNCTYSTLEGFQLLKGVFLDYKKLDVAKIEGNEDGQGESLGMKAKHILLDII